MKTDLFKIDQDKYALICSCTGKRITWYGKRIRKG